ncbi:MAG: hypothetical protein MUF23_08660, partial [Pirellula sp.]|nr:hypothetical protein [Pirellula sp.]
SHSPCWTLMVSFQNRWDVPFDGARSHDGPFAWLGRESSKPGRRSQPDTWVIQMDPAWTQRYLEESPAQVEARIMQELALSSLLKPPAIVQASAHRWRYAQSASSLRETCFWDANTRLGACGDWFARSGIEGSLESGRALAGKILNWLVAHGPSDAGSISLRESPYRQLHLF